MSSFCGTSLLSGGTTLNPRNMNTRMRAERSLLFLLKHTKTFSHSNFSSANSSNETKLSREPSGNTLVGMSTYNTPFTSSVFHSTSFSVLSEHLKFNNRESGLSAISSKSINSCWSAFKLVFCRFCRSPVDEWFDDMDDDEEDDEVDCFLTIFVFVVLVLVECGFMNLFRLPTLPLRMPPSESTHNSCSSRSES